MAANIEVKAKLHDAQSQRNLARQIAGSDPTILIQKDTFFECQHGRLKLREIEGETAQLIHYFRSDDAQVRTSDYVISPIKDVDSMLSLLGREFRVRGIVAKTRLLWIVEQTRIHFDTVQNLGDFVELEFVLQENQDKTEGHRFVNDLMASLDIRQQDVVECAYIDLLERSEATSP